MHNHPHTLTRVSGQSTGTALACVASKYGDTASSDNYVGWRCAAASGSWISVDMNSCSPVTSTYPAIHNHSTYISTFTGTFLYGFC